MVFWAKRDVAARVYMLCTRAKRALASSALSKEKLFCGILLPRLVESLKTEQDEAGEEISVPCFVIFSMMVGLRPPGQQRIDTPIGKIRPPCLCCWICRRRVMQTRLVSLVFDDVRGSFMGTTQTIKQSGQV